MTSRIDPPPTVRSRTTRLAWLVVGVWLLGCSAALWSFERRDAALHPVGLLTADQFGEVRAAAERWHAMAATRHPAAREGRTTLVRVITPGCRCNLANERHLAQITATFGTQQVAIDTITAPDLRGEPGLGGLGAAPTALVFDARGRLVYLGPFSDDAQCGAGAGFVERTLERLARGEHPVARPVVARGCSCGTDAILPELFS